MLSTSTYTYTPYLNAYNTLSLECITWGQHKLLTELTKEQTQEEAVEGKVQA